MSSDFPLDRAAVNFRAPRATGTTEAEAVKRQQIKHGHRGGQNLGERYKRLERSLRGKEALREERDNGSERGKLTGTRIPREVVVFRGVEIPKIPHPPQSDGKFPLCV